LPQALRALRAWPASGLAATVCTGCPSFGGQRTVFCLP